ncbi:putative alcohol dehydrogenase AdhA [uncultured Defluviicoccus sp.]|uniref:Putative alcohol dehydrogenase AdhA n=1 Tax=metagenome TaxID=256318 RepID=A0A380T9E3_9ZZZZ|nr:putative alcohol dehydrogenase AdhA [uncultured Defluviicoccus sp.]
MRLEGIGAPLVMREIPDPEPDPYQVRIEVEACAVCRTDLHIVDGELPSLRNAITPGHEVVGVVDRLGEGVSVLSLGQRVGVGWLGGTCGCCSYCHRSKENLCDKPEFTGYSRDGGFATHMIADARYAYHLPQHGPAEGLAPLMCAGLIGWRSLVFAGEGRTIGLYGFGAAAHIVIQVAKWQQRRVFAFTQPGDAAAQKLARDLGADWTGASSEPPPEPMDAAIIYAPVGALVPLALKNVRRGGRVVCAGIHMSDIPSFPYRDLWGERQIVSVANLTRQDAHDFLQLVHCIDIRTHTTVYPLAEANRALDDLRAGRLQGAAVLAV